MANLQQVEDRLATQKKHNETLREQNERIKEQVQLSEFSDFDRS